MKYLKTYESFKYSNDELLEEGWREWFIGALMGLSTLAASGQEPTVGGQVVVPSSKETSNQSVVFKDKIQIVNQSDKFKDKEDLAKSLISSFKEKSKEDITKKDSKGVKYNDGSEIYHSSDSYSGSESIMLIKGNNALSIMKQSDGKYQIMLFSGSNASQVNDVNGAEVFTSILSLL